MSMSGFMPGTFGTELETEANPKKLGSDDFDGKCSVNLLQWTVVTVVHLVSFDTHLYYDVGCHVLL